MQTLRIGRLRVDTDRRLVFAGRRIFKLNRDVKRIEIEYFEVKIEDEGGTERVNAKFTNFKDAWQAVEHAKSQKLYHYGDPPKKTDTIVVYESFQEYVDADKASLRKSGLEKLTKAERMALGIK